MRRWTCSAAMLLLCGATMAVMVVRAAGSSGFSDVEENSMDDNEPHFARIKTVPKTGKSHKPIFTQCTSYAPSIKEQQPKGEHVITVQASDDDPLDNGGRITYSINKRDGDRAYFKIHNTTGRITTNYEFDRDEPSRLKEIYISVQATDNGRPALTDICTFKVTITDINDNTPSFDQVDFNEKVSEDLPLGAEVMRVVAYDIDDGDNAKLTYDIKNDHSDSGNEFNEYFQIDRESGVLTLKQELKKREGAVFSSYVVVRDSPVDPTERKEHQAQIKITVVGSDKKPPSFIVYPDKKTIIKENFNSFNEPVVILEAKSNIDDPSVIFELVRGLTTQTNKDSTFQLEQDKSRAYIKVARGLDYETVTDYQLTVRCTNKDSWSVIRTIDIGIEDVNDEVPTFLEFIKGSVLENENPGAEVMQVRAVDKDGTSANNIVSYELVDHTDLFDINPNNGKVTTRVSFDREKQEVYVVNIMAKDNSPSALTGKPFNSASQTFRITIEDINDNNPHFVHSNYVAEKIPENSDIGKDVIEVKAEDDDTASLIHYKIIDGNIDNAFMIMNTTGRIKVNKMLDFEKIESYNLTVEANDGLFQDTAMVYIEILNVNDELPEFFPYNGNITIKEELIPSGCIIELRAFDPDIKDRQADQRIVYRVIKNNDFLEVDEFGCVKLARKLDRDRPNGSPVYQGYIYAHDDGDGPNSNARAAEIFIHLEDINDNAPFLNVTEVVWYENQEPGGIISELFADDYDSPINGPPFTFQLAADAGEEIKNLFEIEGYVIRAISRFDREERKYYNIRIEITDSGNPSLTGIGILKVIIGDVNDNQAQDGQSNIFVYTYMGNSPDMVIGRVFVEDPDDWDLEDKSFRWRDINDKFQLNSDNGEITLLRGASEGVYTLDFVVTEDHPPLIMNNVVNAQVTVTVKDLPEEAVIKSGSIRMTKCTAEEFITKDGVQMSKKDILQRHLADVLNTSYDNVDVITVMPSPNNDSTIDVRFAAHGSPYYEAEKLNYRVANSSVALERKLGVEFVMIDINECYEDTCPENCFNNLMIRQEPAVIFTNRTSFVGVRALVEPSCDLRPIAVTCLNGGVYIEETLCQCPDGFDGPRCEILGIGFSGNGWAMYDSFDAASRTEISLELTTQQDNGLVFYEGPQFPHPPSLTSDFISLELKNGFPRLLLSYGGPEVTEVILDFKKLNDDLNHNVRINLQPNEILLSVDDCHKSSCQILRAPKGSEKFLNVNGPLQVGGIAGNIKQIAAVNGWTHVPTHYGFSGCIRNLTFNGQVWNLGQPGESTNGSPNCLYSIARAVSFRIDSNFLVAILVCIAILIILLLAVVVHRRKHDNWTEKDTDDIRETIISYEDEGGGEGDTGFDMSVLRRLQEDEYVSKEAIKTPEVPDISGFLGHKKDTCDRDQNSYPFDDVRYYAYEGGGDSNSQGSLSSLASCTDDGDLKFNYLSSFGPRFRKLADMYGEDPSDVDSQDGGEESWC